jgi:hypothetical protein
MKTMLIVLLIAAPCFGQEAKVLQVEPADATKAQELYEKMQQAEKDWKDYVEATKEKYLTVPYDSPERGNQTYERPSNTTTALFSGSGCILWGTMAGESNKCEQERESRMKQREKEDKLKPWHRAGWESMEFEFSKDFKFIVPKPRDTGIVKSNYPCMTLTNN